jgi:hypothetical protein
MRTTVKLLCIAAAIVVDAVPLYAVAMPLSGGKTPLSLRTLTEIGSSFSR